MEKIPLDAKAKVLKTSDVPGGSQIVGDHAGDGTLVHAVRYVLSKPAGERDKFSITVPGFSLMRSEAIAQVAQRPDFPID